MNKAQELKERIYKHCPELKELSFGCRVLVSHPEYRNIIVDTINQDIKHTIEMARQSKMPDYFGDCYFVTRGFASNRPEKLLGRRDLKNIFIIEEIIGHPIQLQHVLRAIERNKKGIVIGTDGIFWRLIEINNKLEFYVFKHQWDLKKTFDQNISDDPKLLEFLLAVIK